MPFAQTRVPLNSKVFDTRVADARVIGPRLQSVRILWAET